MAKKFGIYFILIVLISVFVFSAAAGQEREIYGYDYKLENTNQQWAGVDYDEVMILETIYDQEMTGAGRAYSGWFPANNFYPCSWNGITCEDGHITGLYFKDAGFFYKFPESVLGLHQLKELHIVNGLMTGSLPYSLFEELWNLRVLDLQGNLLTGTFPAIPGGYHPLVALAICDNLITEAKQQAAFNPEYSEVSNYFINAYNYDQYSMMPGLSDEIPSNLGNFPQLTIIDLSGNRLYGNVPDSLSFLALTSLDVRDNASYLVVSPDLYQYWAGLGNGNIIFDGMVLSTNVKEINEQTIIDAIIGQNTDGEYIQNQDSVVEGFDWNQLFQGEPDPIDSQSEGIFF